MNCGDLVASFSVEAHNTIVKRAHFSRFLSIRNNDLRNHMKHLENLILFCVRFVVVSWIVISKQLKSRAMTERGYKAVVKCTVRCLVFAR